MKFTKHAASKTLTLFLAISIIISDLVYPVDAQALAPMLRTQLASFRRLATQMELQGVLLCADSPEDKELLAAHFSEAVLVSSGKILVSRETSQDSLKLIRAIFHEQIEAILQIMQFEDRNRYNALKELILSRRDLRNAYFGLLNKPAVAKRQGSLSADLLLNDMLARAFELVLLKDGGLLADDDIMEKERAFLQAIEPVINANRHNYFTGVFWEWGLRERKIAVALANGYRFDLVAAATAAPDPKEDADGAGGNKTGAIIPAALTPANPLSIPTDVSMPPELAAVVRNGPTAIVPFVMGNPALVEALRRTQIWGGPEDIRQTVVSATAGADRNEVTKAVRQLVGGLGLVPGQANARSTALLICNALLQHWIEANQYMQIVNETLRRIDPELAENLKNLTDGDEQTQIKSFHWLFDRMMKEAAVCLGEMHEKGSIVATEHALIFRIIMEEINKVMVSVGETKWAALRGAIASRFAQEIYDEITGGKEGGGMERFAIVFLACYPDISKNFFAAVDTNLGIWTRALGKEKFADAAETLLSFACRVWPDEYFTYMKENFNRADETLRAYYLSAMRFGMRTRAREGGNEDGKIQYRFDQGRVEFITKNTLLMARRGLKAKVLKDKCGIIIYSMAPFFVDYLLDEKRGDCYSKLDKEPRFFVLACLVNAAVGGRVDRAALLPFIRNELGKDYSTAFVEAAFQTNYFTDDLLARMNPEDARALRRYLYCNYKELLRSPAAADRAVAIGKFFGISFVFEAFEFYKTCKDLDFARAFSALVVAGKTAAVAVIKTNELPLYDSIVTELIGITRTTIEEKRGLQVAYFNLQERVVKAKKEMERLEPNIKQKEEAIQKIRGEIEEGTQQKNSLILEQNMMRQSAEAASGAAQEAWGQIQALETVLEPLRKPWFVKVLVWTNLIAIDASSEAGLKVKEERLRALYSAYRDSLKSSAGLETNLPSMNKQIETATERLRKAQQALVQFGEEFDRETAAYNRFKHFVEVAAPGEVNGISGLYDGACAAASNFNTTMRDFLSNGSITPEMRGRYFERFSGLAENEAIFNCLHMATLPDQTNQRNGAQQAAAESETAKLIDYQSERYFFTDSITLVLRYIADLIEKGRYVPAAARSQLFKTLCGHLERSATGPSREGRLTQVEDAIGKAEQKLSRETKAILDEVDSFISILGEASFLDNMHEFLKHKVKSESDRSKLIATMAFFTYVLGMKPIEVVKWLFYELSPAAEKYFIGKSEQPIGEAKDLNEKLAKCYDTYLDKVAICREEVNKLRDEQDRIYASYGWDGEANNDTIGLLMRIFAAEGTPDEVRKEAEACFFRVFLHWKEAWCFEGARPAQAPKANIRSSAILSAVMSYVNHSKGTGQKRSFYLVVYYLAKRVVQKARPGQSLGMPSEDIKILLQIFEEADRIIPDNIRVQEGGKECFIKAAIKEALRKLRPKKNIDRTRFPQLPGSEERRPPLPFNVGSGDGGGRDMVWRPYISEPDGNPPKSSDAPNGPRQNPPKGSPATFFGVIYAFFADRQTVSLKELCERVGVAESTARRDINRLAAAGLIGKVPGDGESFIVPEIRGAERAGEADAIYAELSKIGPRPTDSEVKSAVQRAAPFIPLWEERRKAIDLLARECAGSEKILSVDDLKKEIAGLENSGSSLILYADDILGNGAFVDIESTVRSILAGHNVLNGGKVIIFGRDPRKATVLNAIMKRADPLLETCIVTQDELDEASGTGKDDVKESQALLKVARRKNCNVLAVLRGPSRETKQLASVYAAAKAPAIIIGPEAGIYSFADALRKADMIKKADGANGWLIILEPIRAWSADLQAKYETYRESLKALVAA